MSKHYYQKVNDIGKQIALISSSNPINDSVHYREVKKEYYDAVIQLLREQTASSEEVEE